MRLIDADALVDTLEKAGMAVLNTESIITVSEIVRIVRELPTIKPRKGTWERVSSDRYVSTASYVFRCNQCGADFVGYWSFCANCGADMRGSKDETDRR